MKLAKPFGALALGIALAACGQPEDPVEVERQQVATRQAASAARDFLLANVENPEAVLRCVNPVTSSSRNTYTVFVDGYYIRTGYYNDIDFTLNSADTEREVLSIHLPDAAAAAAGRMYGAAIETYYSAPDQWTCFGDQNGNNTSVAHQNRLSVATENVPQQVQPPAATQP
ncbi:MAG: hypothetical protein GC136_09975 [Alphaproteobacteria bacterium]|nr:hypothetical protein [Alphaproteobacteria bacterium]